MLCRVPLGTRRLLRKGRRLRRSRWRGDRGEFCVVELELQKPKELSRPQRCGDAGAQAVRRRIATSPLVPSLWQFRVEGNGRGGSEARGEGQSVAEVLLQARDVKEPDIPNLVHSDNEVRGWVATVLMDQCEVWVAVVDSEIVGMMALREDWIEQMYVAPGHTSRGIGARLIATAQDRRPAGLQLWTFEANRRAQRFYERHGFVAVERSDGSRNEAGAPDVRYRWTESSKKSARQDE